MTVVTKARAWDSRDFRYVWTASATSTFGSEVGELAIPLLALTVLAADAGELGALRAAQFLPFLLATLPLGLLVDRRARLPLMIRADVGRAVLVVLIPIGVWVGFAGMPLLYAIAFCVGVLTVLYHLADFAFLPEIVTTDQLVDANGKISATHSVNEVGGRGFGGALVEAVSAPFAVLLNACTYALSGWSLSRVSVKETRRAGASALAGREVTIGLRELSRNRYMRATLGDATTFLLFNQVFLIGVMLFAVREVELNGLQVGLIFAAGGLGAFLGAWFGPRVADRFGFGRILLLALLMGNGIPVLAAAAPEKPIQALMLLSIIFVVMGVGIGVSNVYAISLRQRAVTEAIRGRVNAAYRFVSWGSIPLGAALGGVIASHAGAYVAMVVGSIGMATATLWVAFSPIPRLRSIADIPS